MITIVLAFLGLLALISGGSGAAALILILAAITAFVNAYDIYKEQKEYKKSQYYIGTKNPLYRVKHDRGLSGEYKIYQTLSDCLPWARFLFNLYLPKDDGETTEVDVIMIINCLSAKGTNEVMKPSVWSFAIHIFLV